MLHFKDQVRDWYIQGLQLNKCYIKDWESITNTFKKYKIFNNEFGPLLTLNECRLVNIADEFTKELCKQDYLKDVSSRDIFVVVLHTFPLYCQQVGENMYKKKFVDQKGGVFSHYLAVQGTTKDKIPIFENMLRNIYGSESNDIPRKGTNIPA
jgi:hypothetical protein